MDYKAPLRVEITPEKVRLIDADQRVVAEDKANDRQFTVNAYNALASAANRQMS